MRYVRVSADCSVYDEDEYLGMVRHNVATDDWKIIDPYFPDEEHDPPPWFDSREAAGGWLRNYRAARQEAQQRVARYAQRTGG